MKPIFKVSSLFLFLHFSLPLSANSIDDFFRSTGKINTVLAVVLILFFVIIALLLRMEKKVKNLEQSVNNNE